MSGWLHRAAKVRTSVVFPLAALPTRRHIHWRAAHSAMHSRPGNWLGSSEGAWSFDEPESLLPARGRRAHPTTREEGSK
jgi:hypothetical protein